jgi:hypothetical protein
VFDRNATAAATIYPHVVTLAEAADRAALQHLVVAYCHGIDRRDYALLRSLYHEDAIDDHSPYYCGSARGYVDWLPTIMATWSKTAHSIDNMLFLVEGDCAEGELGAKAYHRTLDGEREFIAYGRYADKYAKRDGIWKFLHRSFILDWSEDRRVAPVNDFGADGVDTGKPGDDDPIYARLPLLSADRRHRANSSPLTTQPN